MANGTLDSALPQLRPIFDAPPTREGWLAACSLIERCAADADTLAEALDFVVAQEWPAKVRMAPLLWINRLVTGRLPVDVLRIVSGLHLLPALYDSVLPPEALMNWLGSLDKSTPALEGLCISGRQEHLAAIDRAVAVEPDSSVHPVTRAYVPSRYHHYNREVLLAVLASPLCRELRVFDVSVDSTIEEEAEYDGFYYQQSRQPHLTLPELERASAAQRDIPDAWESFCNYGFELDRLLTKLPVGTLQVLDLHGHPRGLGRTFSDRKPKALTALRHLNLGGGKSWTALDVARLGRWTSKCPLESVCITDDDSFWAIEDQASDDDVAYERNCRGLEEAWYDVANDAACKLLRKWATREQPPALTVSPGLGAAVPEPVAKALSLSTRSDRKADQWRAPLPSDWTAHFDL